MTKDVKEVLNTCGRNMALITEENCPEILYLAREEILQEIIMGMIDSLKDDSEAIYEIFLKSDDYKVRFEAIKKIHNEGLLKKIILRENVDYRDIVKTQALKQIENKEILKELLKEKAIYERRDYLYIVSEKFEDKDLYEIIISDSYNFSAKLYFVSKIKDRKFLEKLRKELNDKELVKKAKFWLERLD